MSDPADNPYRTPAFVIDAASANAEVAASDDEETLAFLRRERRRYFCAVGVLSFFAGGAGLIFASLGVAAIPVVPAMRGIAVVLVAGCASVILLAAGLAAFRETNLGALRGVRSVDDLACAIGSSLRPHVRLGFRRRRTRPGLIDRPDTARDAGTPLPCRSVRRLATGWQDPSDGEGVG